mgnify:CR=1 FL=1
MDFIQAICHTNGTIYIVGGAVRNMIYNIIHKTNIQIKDIDILVCNIEHDILINILKKYGTVKDVGISFGVILFHSKSMNMEFEIALPRSEKSIGSGYRDFEIIVDQDMTIQQDFSRRDATINSIGYEIKSVPDINNFIYLTSLDELKFVDPYNGINDIKNKIWKAVGNPHERFTEDPTRIMRAFRQSVELSLNIDDATMKGIRDNYILMKELIPKSYVRLYNELFRLMSFDNCNRALNIMNELGILRFLDINCDNIPFFKNKAIIIRLACLLRPELNNDDIKKWTNYHQISATNYISPDQVKILCAIQLFWNDFINIKNRYDMCKLVQNVYCRYQNLNYMIIFEMINYLNELNYDINLIKFYEQLLDETKLYPSSIDHIKLNGNEIMKLMNINGKQIKSVKEHIINKIYMNELQNDNDQLKSYIDNNKSFILI